MKGDGLTAHGFMLEVHVKGETKIDGFYMMLYELYEAINILSNLPLMTVSKKCSEHCLGRENAS